MIKFVVGLVLGLGAVYAEAQFTSGTLVNVTGAVGTTNAITTSTMTPTSIQAPRGAFVLAGGQDVIGDTVQAIKVDERGYVVCSDMLARRPQ